MLKAELHSHTSDDPRDIIPYDNTALIDRAAALGYNALAITLHDRQLDVRDLTRYARGRGIVLLPGLEKTIQGKHLLLLNFPAEAETVSSFDDVRRLKAKSDGIVIAPHPFFPTRSCLRGLLDTIADLVDAVEINGFYTKTVDFNTRARRWAATHGKPLVGNCDVHRLPQLGSTYSLVDADPDPAAICDAIRGGRVLVCTEPITAGQAGRYLTSMFAGDGLSALRRAPTETVPEIGAPTVS